MAGLPTSPKLPKCYLRCYGHLQLIVIKRTIKIGALPLMMLLFIYGSTYLLYEAGYRFNLTHSMPIGVYQLRNPILPLQQGDLVVFCPPLWVSPTRFHFYAKGGCPGGGEPLLKKVAAIAGDDIGLDERGVSVNHVLLANSACLAKANLPCAKNKQILTDGSYWVYGEGNAGEDAKYSFDSRYFGAVKDDVILAVATIVPQ